MKLKVDVQQVFISTAGVFKIGLLWVNFNIKVFKMVCYLISAPFTRQDSAPFSCQNCVPFDTQEEEEELYDKVVDAMVPQ